MSYIRIMDIGFRQADGTFSPPTGLFIRDEDGALAEDIARRLHKTFGKSITEFAENAKREEEERKDGREEE